MPTSGSRSPPPRRRARSPRPTPGARTSFRRRASGSARRSIRTTRRAICSSCSSPSSARALRSRSATMRATPAVVFECEAAPSGALRLGQRAASELDDGEAEAWRTTLAGAAAPAAPSEPWRLPLISARGAIGALALWTATGEQEIVRRARRARRGRPRERAPLPQPAGRDRGKARDRGAAAGVEPAQGRVPGDALARAAQSARADPHRDRSDPPGRARRAQAELGDGHHPAPGQPADAAGRGPARRRAHQPGQDHAAARVARLARRHRACGRDGAAVREAAPAPAHEERSRSSR